MAAPAPSGEGGEGNEGEETEDDGNEALMAHLESCGLDPDQLAKAKSLLGGGEPALDEEEDVDTDMGEDEDEDIAEDDDMPDNAVTKEAMDKALKKTADDTAERVRKSMTAAAEAREVVRPWVGTVAIAHDRALKVYQAAAATLKIEGADKVSDTTALQLLIKAQPKPGDHRASDSVHTLANDVASDLSKRFPHAANIGGI